jgi:hypothetical protein
MRSLHLIDPKLSLPAHPPAPGGAAGVGCRHIQPSLAALAIALAATHKLRISLSLSRFSPCAQIDDRTAARMNRLLRT